MTGRPSKYKPEYCNVAIKLMKKGHSKQSVAGRLGISRDTLYEWCRTYPDFSDTIKVGEMMSYAYWEELGMKAMMGKVKGFRPSFWIFTMKARFGWRDNSPVRSLEDDIGKLERELVPNKLQITMAQIIKNIANLTRFPLFHSLTLCLVYGVQVILNLPQQLLHELYTQKFGVRNDNL